MRQPGGLVADVLDGDELRRGGIADQVRDAVALRELRQMAQARILPDAIVLADELLLVEPPARQPGFEAQRVDEVLRAFQKA